MRPDTSEIEFQSFVLDEKSVPIFTDDYSERSVKLLSDNSDWVFREFNDPKKLAQEAMCWEWVNRFFPKMILARRTVYKVEGDKKIAVGSCWEKLPVGNSKIVQATIERLNEFDFPGILAVLFFLGHSYSHINVYHIYSVDYYKIDRFEFPKNQNEKIVEQNKILTYEGDVGSRELIEFLKQHAQVFLSREQDVYEKFCNHYWLALMNIVLMPSTDWDPVLREKQACLRRELLSLNLQTYLHQFPKGELSVRIELFCRQFAERDSVMFFEYRDAIAKNYCLFSMELFSEKIREEASRFLLSLVNNDNNATSRTADESVFHHEIIKSLIGKIYLNIQSQPPSKFSLENFSWCLSILNVLRSCFSICSNYSNDIVILLAVLNRISEVGVSAKQINLIERRSVELSKIDLNQFIEPGFAKQCIDWLRRTEIDGLGDVLINKNLLLYVYQRSMAQFRGAQLKSYPYFLSERRFALPENMEELYQKIVSEKNPNSLCMHMCELIKIAPPDFWNFFLHDLAVIVFCEQRLLDFTLKNIVLYELDLSKEIQTFLNSVKLLPEMLIQLSAHFSRALTVEIEENHSSQTAGFRHSGSSSIFSDVVVSQSTSNQNQQVSSNSSWLGYVRRLIAMNF